MKFNQDLKKLDIKDCFRQSVDKVNAYKKQHPNVDIVSLGVGDVSIPVSDYITNKMIEACKHQNKEGFAGYGNYYGISELREAIRINEYPAFSKEEIYVSDGTKNDVGNILELFDKDVQIGIVNPTYPIYLNGIISYQREYKEILCDEDFNPIVPNYHLDVIYLCSPNNPVGINYSKEVLEKWIEYALKEKAVIIYDNVYFKFIDKGIRSIYQIDNARKCAIEMRSFSKHLSFTGVRCSYYVVPNDLYPDINKYWSLRVMNRFNGASYIAQIGALASFDKQAKETIDISINYYKENAKLLNESFSKLGYKVVGEQQAPYLWIKCKDGYSSWEMFDYFLEKCNVVIIPGIIFGKYGDDYFRVSALGKREDIIKAIERVKEYEENK